MNSPQDDTSMDDDKLIKNIKEYGWTVMLIEAHLKDKYHLVDYHSPYNNEFAKAGLFLINLSGLKEEVY